jgi:antitoxin FitA
MGQLLIRKLDDRVKARIQRLAKRNGRSMEAEAREILDVATLEKKKEFEVGFGTATAALFSGQGIGLEKGEEIREIRGMKMQVPNFDE